jgi:GH43 family beta-xylosidase
MGNHVWAPELHYMKGKWYIYFAAGDAEDKWRIRPYVLECGGAASGETAEAPEGKTGSVFGAAVADPMNDPWQEKGMMQCADDDEFSFRAFSLDATVFENRGEYYYIWAEKVGVGRMISNLYIARMESPTKLATVQVLLTTPDYDWERRGFWVNEGPAVLKHNGKIFVTYSASDTGVNYCMGMLSIDEKADMLDPACWTKKRYPVLKTDEKKGIYGPGHNSFTVDGDGDPVIVFHARTEKEITGDPLYNPNRHAMLRNILWGIDGEPKFLL